jgi:hypothetical protein
MRGDHHSGGRIRLVQAGFAPLATLGWAWVAADARFHWDEPGYWYTAAYLSVPDILAGNFQPSGIDGFSNSRVGHILLLKLLSGVFGPGPASLALMIAAYLAMLAIFLWLAYRLLQSLSAGASFAGAAIVACALTPIFVYLAFKTVAEIPALVLSTVAALAFVRSLRERPVPWLAIVVLALAGVAFTKNHIAILPASMIVAMLLSGGLGYPMRRIVVHAIVAGLSSLTLFAILLYVAGMPLDRYLAVGTFVAEMADPLAVRLSTLVLECGPVLLLLPFALLSPRKTHLRFFGLWFVLATVPLLLSPRVEDRYLVGNLVPMLGLAQLSFEGLEAWVRNRIGAPERVLTGLGMLGTVALLALSALVQPLMLHGIRSDQLSALMRQLDARYGAGRYAIVTPSEYTTFLYLRFMYPDRAVYTVFTPAPPNHRDPRVWEALQRRYYGPLALPTLESLRSLSGPILYVSPDANPTVATLRDFLEHVPRSKPRELAEGVIARMHPGNPDEMSWMWSDARLELCVVERHGHYVAWQVRFCAEAEGGAACS